MKTISSTIIYLSDKIVSIAINESNNLYYVSVSCRCKTNPDLNSHHSSDAYSIDKIDKVQNIYLNYIKNLLRDSIK